MPKQILSIDVGIKNLSFCLFEIDDVKDIKVLKWDNIDLTKQDAIESKCVYIESSDNKQTNKKVSKSKSKTKVNTITDFFANPSNKNTDPCGKPAKFMKDNKCYCLKHSKLTNYIQPAADLKPSYLNKQTLQKLIDIAIKYKVINTLETSQSQSYKKAQLVSLIKEFSEKNCFLEVKKSNAAKIDLVTIGRNIQHRFDDILCDYLLTIDTIIIENQIGPIANKMKTIQGMLSQYFIMKNNNISIDFISATNKLKDFITLDKDKDKDKEKMEYKDRKKLGIQICSNFVSETGQFKEWNIFFSKHQKKDDLSDCFLQGMWYIKHNKNI
jgi:hypothetical protein